MDEFNYLSVLLSVVLGLALTQILQGFRARMLSHAHIRRYWPTQAWAAILMLIIAQSWWAMFDLRHRQNWEFDQFFALLAHTIATYLVAGLVFPDMPRDTPIDLRAHYFAQRKRFFSLAIVSALASIFRDYALNHALPHPTNLAFHFVFIACAASGIVIRQEWFHQALPVMFGVIYIRYIILLFTKLQ